MFYKKTYLYDEASFFDSSSRLEFNNISGEFKKLNFIQYLFKNVGKKITKEEFFKNVPYCECLKSGKQDLIERPIDIIEFFKKHFKDIYIRQDKFHNFFIISKNGKSFHFFCRKYRDYACVNCETCLSEKHLLLEKLKKEAIKLEYKIKKEDILNKVCGKI
jgi:hypothetical protein